VSEAAKHVDLDKRQIGLWPTGAESKSWSTLCNRARQQKLLWSDEVWHSNCDV